MEFKSVCPYDCPDACGLIVESDEKEVFRVRGNKEHSFTRGTLCPKMVHYEDTVHSPKRLTKPLRRTGKKGSGEFEEISWEEAIETITNHWKHTIDQYGGKSLLTYSYAGTMGKIQTAAYDPLFASLGATRSDRGICSPAKRYGYGAVMGQSYGTRPQEAAESDLIILWGIDAVCTNIHFQHDVKAAQMKGAKVWIIDTHKTPTFNWADESIIVRPGTDGALALGIAHFLHREGRVDYSFIERHVQGYDEWAEKVLPAYTLDKVEEITGVDEDTLMNLALDYSQAKAPFIRLGSGLTRYGNGAMTTRAISTLPAMVGAYKHMGGGFLSSVSGSSFLSAPMLDWHLYTDEKVRMNPMIKLGKALTEMKHPKIKCLFVYASNPAITAPDQNVVRKGLAREDLFTVVHERFMTDTAKYADIVLPATTSLEHDDIYNSYGHYNVGCGYQIIEPVGESKSNWKVACLLAKAMGLTHPIFDKSERDLIYEIVEQSSAFTGIEKLRILAGEPVEVRLPRNYKMQFKTPSGKIEIYNPLEEEPYPIYQESHGDQAEFFLINAPDARILDSSFCERDLRGQETMVAWMNRQEATERNIEEGRWVALYNERGSVEIPVRLSHDIPKGTIVTNGVWWQEYSSDDKVGINALTSSRPTDKGNGSTFYDVKVNVKLLKQKA